MASGTPIFVRTFSSVLSYARDYDSGIARLRLFGWHKHERVDNGFVSGDHDALAWFSHGSWRMAFRHRSVTFDPVLDQRFGRDVFGQHWSAHIIPTTIVAPLVTTAAPGGTNSRCLRIFPPTAAPAFERLVLDEPVEFRICRSKVDESVQTYVEANFGGARYNAVNEPRRAVYLPDHRIAPEVRATALVARALMYLPQFVTETGFEFDPAVRRGDLVHVGSYGQLPLHRSLFAQLRWPAATESALLAFEATHRERVVGVSNAAAAIAEVDESADTGHFITWHSAPPAKARSGDDMRLPAFPRRRVP